MRRSRRPNATDELPAFDPLADVLFGAVALVFVALLIVAPRIAASRQPAGDPAAEDRTGLTFDGRETPVLIAGADGLRSTISAAPIALDAIAADAALARALEAARLQADGRIILLIEPQGGETAFTLDPILARGGFHAIEQIRLMHPCGPSGRPVSPRDCLRQARS